MGWLESLLPLSKPPKAVAVAADYDCGTAMETEKTTTSLLLPGSADALADEASLNNRSSEASHPESRQAGSV